jgi:hypothetical protein
MLHKAEEWKMIGHAPKIKLMKEHGRHLRLDDKAENRLLEAAKTCRWRSRTFELFHDIVILMRDTGMRNQNREDAHENARIPAKCGVLGAESDYFSEIGDWLAEHAVMCKTLLPQEIPC